MENNFGRSINDHVIQRRHPPTDGLALYGYVTNENRSEQTCSMQTDMLSFLQKNNEVSCAYVPVVCGWI